MYETFADKYDKFMIRYVALIERNLKKRIATARDKEAISAQIAHEVAHVEKLMGATPKAADLIEDFVQQYKRGTTIDEIISDLNHRYGDNRDLFTAHIDKEKELNIYSSADESGRVTLLASDKQKLLKFLVRYMAVQQIKGVISFLSETANKSDNAKRTLQHAVTWTGSRNNNNEFVQLIYGLYQAGYLNEGTGEITKIVESLGALLNISLGKGWQSNLSSSVHKSKKDYEPPIFDKIKQAYLRYADELVIAKKINK